MSSENICAGYAVGFCPFEEFNAGEITKSCPNNHDSYLKNLYLSKSSEISRSILEEARTMIKTIIKDTDKKISHHLKMIEPKLDSESLNALEKLESIIESKNVDNFADVHPLLRLHGRLCHEIEEKGLKESEFTVCENCGAFKESSNCLHGFCVKYSKLRLILEELENRMNN